MSKLIPPRIIPCAEWGARPVKIAFTTKPAEGIVTHHTAGENATPLLDPEKEEARCARIARQIQSHHMTTNGWADSGQHFTLFRSGLILEGRHGSLRQAMRGRCVRGAHCGVGPVNGTHFGIEIEGRYDQEYLVTEDQWSALIELCAWLSFWGDFQSSAIEPHCKYKATACPGKIKDILPKLRAEVRSRKLELLQRA